MSALMHRETVRALRAIGERAVALDGGALTLPSAGGTISVSATGVQAMLSEGLLHHVDGKVARTDAGRVFLRRALAGASGATVPQHQLPVERAVGSGRSALKVMENAAESPLAWLSTRKDRTGKAMITPLQREAGERLCRDHTRGHQQPSITASWDPTGVRASGPRDGLTVSEAAEDARRRVERALAAVGPGLAETLVAVCCEGTGLETLEKRFGWPARSGKVVLRLALDRLARHYGHATHARGTKRCAIIQWGAADYRPTA